MRTTKEQLQKKVNRIKEITGDHYELSSAYGGYALYAGEGGTRNVLCMGHVRAGQLLPLLEAYIYGLMDAHKFYGK